MAKAKARYQRRLTAEILETRQMFALEPTFNGVGFTRNGVPGFDQKSTTMGFLLDPTTDPIDGVPLRTVLGGYRIDPDREFFPDSGQPELQFFTALGAVSNIGPASVPVGLGDARIAGIDSYIDSDGFSNIVTAGYVEVSGDDIVFTLDFQDISQGNPFAVTSLGRDFYPEDVGGTIRILEDTPNGFLEGDYTIRAQAFLNGRGYALLDVSPVAVPTDGVDVVGGFWALQDPDNDLISTDFLVSQYFLNFAGQVVLDTSFGRNGHAIIPIASGVNNFDYGYAIDIEQGTNKILVAGYSQNDEGEYDFSVLRLMPDGFLDPTFYFSDQPGGPVADRGRVQIDIDGSDYANAIDINEDLDIMVAGSSGGANSPLLTFVKLRPSGSLDLTFDSADDSDGIVVVPRTVGRNGFINDIEEYRPNSTTPGFYIASGTLTGTNRDTVLVRINDETGELDETFANQGVLRLDLGLGQDDWGNSVALQPTAVANTFAIVIGGSIEIGNEGFNMFVARFNDDGTNDTTFNDGSSFFVVDLQDATTQNRDDYGATILINRYPTLGTAPPEKYILISGSTELTSAGDFDFVIAAVVGFPDPLIVNPLVSALSRWVTEPDSGFSTMLIDLVLDKPATGPLTVRFTTQNGTAKAGTDYVAKTNSVTFSTGSTSRTVSVQLVGNTQYQANRSFSLAITEVEGDADVAEAVANVEIRDNDGTWQNLANPEDADADGDVEPHDILQVKDALNRFGFRQLIQATSTPSLFTDVTGDTWFSPADLLRIIDRVNRSFAARASTLLNSTTLVGSGLLSSTESDGGDASADVAQGLSMVGVCPVGPYVINPTKPVGVTVSGLSTVEIEPVYPPAAEVAFAEYNADPSDSYDADLFADDESSDLFELIANS